MKRKLKKWVVCFCIAVVGFYGLYVYEDSGFLDQQFSKRTSEAIMPNEPYVMDFHFPNVDQLGKDLRDFVTGVADRGEAVFDNAVSGVADISSGSVPKENESIDGVMKIHFIDVGQGDAILLQQGDECMLVDAGDNDKGSFVCQYLSSAGVEYLTYLCVTHPDADHCGGVDDVLEMYGTTNLLMAQCTNDTVTYDEMMYSIEKTASSVEYPSSGDTYRLGEADITILCPLKDTVGVYEDTNDYSIGILVEYGDISCVMCGDASENVEMDIVSSGIDIDADILKLGHHGSNTSSCDAFLDAVSPDYAVISAGIDSKYGHPHQEVMQRLQERRIGVFRTDLQGTVVVTTDGDDMSWNIDVCQDYTCGSDLSR